MLNEDKRKQLDTIVQEMTINKESDSNIQFVVDDFKAKYDQPELEEQPELMREAPFGKALGTGFDLLKGAAKGVGSTIVGTGQLGARTLGRLTGSKERAESTVGFGEELKEGVLKPEGTAEQIGFTGEQIGEFFIPGAVGLKAPKTLGILGRAGLAGLEAGGITALQTGKVGKEAATTAALGGVLSGAGGALAKSLEKLPNRLVQSAIKQSPKELAKGQDLTEFVLKTKLPKTSSALLDDSAKIIEDLNTKITGNLKSVKPVKGGSVSPKKIIKEVAEEINKAGGDITEKEARGIIEGLAPQVKGTLKKSALSLEDANKLRQKIDRTLGDRAFFSQQNTFNKSTLMDFANTLRETVKKKAPEGTRGLYDDIAKEIRFSNALGDKVVKGQRNQIISFGDLIGGGIGAGVGGPAGAIAGAGLRRGIQSTPGLLTGAKVVDAINKAEPVLEKLSTAEQGLLSQLIQAIFSEDQNR